MNRELCKYVLAIGIMLLFFWKVISPQFLCEYSASLIDKMEVLKGTDEPKIVLIGDSNLSFGIKSKLIEEATGMKVVNMGLHGGLGNAFHEEMAKENVNPGDIYIVCHTNYADDDTIDSSALEWITIENHFNLWTCVPVSEWYSMMQAYPTYVKKCVRKYLDGTGNLESDNTPYSRYSFNEYGDNIFNETHEEHYIFENDYKSPIPQIDDACIDRLNKLNQYITDKGGTLLIGGYPIAYGEEKPNQEEWSAFKEVLQSKLDFPIICDYSEYFYSYDYFFNTCLHLTNEGAIIRTKQMIKDIEEYMESVEN